MYEEEWRGGEEEWRVMRIFYEEHFIVCLCSIWRDSSVLLHFVERDETRGVL